MLKRLLLGLLKGLLVGGALGAAAHALVGPTLTGVGAYALYALVGGLAGLVAGRPAWRQGAGVAAILRGVFGLGVGVGLYALAARFLTFLVAIPGAVAPAATSGALGQLPLFLAPLVATVYAVLVELDDGGENPEPAVKSKVRIDVDDIRVDEEEAPAQKGAASGQVRKR